MKRAAFAAVFLVIVFFCCQIYLKNDGSVSIISRYTVNRVMIGCEAFDDIPSIFA